MSAPRTEVNGGNIISVRRRLTTILRSTSRSFYISIRLLPRRLREPVKLAYLLARATDTIADTVAIPASVRREALANLAGAIQGEGAANTIVDLGRSFAPLQSDESERALIEALPECFELLELFNAADRGDIRELLGKITRGQMLDVDRFGSAEQVRALHTAADLREYTYLVAGCVGEFWTRLCFRYVANFADETETQMAELGKRYGQGLQLINILRDAHVDLASGRCYFPADELMAAALTPAQIIGEPLRFLGIYAAWLEEAQRGLESGMEYVRAINHFRVRGATVLPALIGARTLSMLRAAGPGALRERIKVPRAEVRSMIGTVALTLAKRKQLDEMFRRFSGDYRK
ncbi:MAG: phytoene/squalene synthase family protein [Spartobacteria bacterium]